MKILFDLLLAKSITHALFFFSKVGKLIAVMAEDGEEWKEVAQSAGENDKLTFT